MTSRCIRYHSSMHRYRRDLIEVRYIQKQRFKSVLSVVENNINKALEYNVVYLQGSVSARLTNTWHPTHSNGCTVTYIVK